MGSFGDVEAFIHILPWFKEHHRHTLVGHSLDQAWVVNLHIVATVAVVNRTLVITAVHNLIQFVAHLHSGWSALEFCSSNLRNSF